MTDRTQRRAETPEGADRPSGAPEVQVPAELLLDPLPGLAMLVAEVAHEIHNPISYVLGNLRALDERMGPLLDAIEAHRRHLGVDRGDATIEKAERRLEGCGGLEGVEELVSDALEGAFRIRDLVRDLLTVSRSGGRSPTPLDPNSVVAATVRLVSRPLRRRTDFEMELRATRFIEGDAARLGQVFLNLLTNAIDACETPGVAPLQIRVRTEDTANGIRVEIHDSGGGVDPELGERIFDPFSTTKDASRGTGLGLYLSRRIVEEHGGTIGYRSRPGGGTVFFVELPELGGSVSEAGGGG